MSEVLTSSTWGFVAVVVAIVAIAITIYFARKQTQKKELSYETMNTELVKVDSRITDRLQVNFDGKPVGHLHLVFVRFVNSGNIPIDANDYQGDISVTFGEKSQILKCEISEEEPEDIPISTKNDENKVEIKPTLLNEKDSFTLKLLVSNFKKVSITGRIKGVKAITVIKAPPSEMLWFPVTATGLTLLVIGTVLINAKPSNFLFAPLIISGMCMVIVANIYSNIIPKRKHKFKYQKTL
jgi:hypothetical protein